MKGLVGIILGIVMLLAGCGRSVDSRLSLADSLIDEQADSAYVVLKGVNTDELTRSSDKAYYALLYTQAQYKNFDSIPNDSLINIALHHYSDNHNRELNTRTLIYKGAVMQELGNETEAMEWYKRAEDNASPDDYMNLGQANLRMAMLYALNYADNDETLEKERRALRYFRKAGSKSYELMCLSSIGGGYRQCNMDSAYYYLHQAITLAKELKDDNQLYSCTEMLARAYNEDSLYAESKALSLDYLANNGTDHIDDDIYYDLAYSYAKIGMADSAQFYFDKTAEHPQEDSKIVMRIFVKETISLLKGEYDDAYNYGIVLNQISEQIVAENKPKEIENQDRLFSSRKYHNQNIKLARNQKIYIILIVISFIVVIVLVIIVYRRKLLHKKEIREYEQLIIQYKKEKSQEEKEYELTKKLELQQIAKYNIQILNEINTCVVNFSENPEHFLKRLKNIKEELQKQNNTFWSVLRKIVNETYDNVLTKIEKEYPNLSEDDVKIISMMYMDFSLLTISVCMGFTNEKSIYQRKKRIAQKMNLTISLDEFCSANKCC